MVKDEIIFRKIIARKEKYFCWVSRPASMQRLTLLVRAFHKCLQSEVINFRGQGRDISYYFEKTPYRRAALALSKKLSSESAINKHFFNYRQYKNRLLTIGLKARKIRPDRLELFKIFNGYESIMLDFSYYLISPFFIDEYIFPDLAKKLKKILPEDKLADALETISTPTIVFGYQKYYQELARARKPADYERIAARYQWIKEYSFQEKLLDARAARADQKELSISGLLQASLEVAKANQRNKQKLTNLISSLKDQKIKRQIQLVHNYVNIKTERIEAYKMFQADFRQFFYSLLKLVQKNQPAAKYEDVISLTDEEIVLFLKHQQKIDLEITSQRFALNFASVSQAGKMIFTYNQPLIKRIRRSFMVVETQKEIKGCPVSRGKVRGRVRLIIHRSDLNKIKKGEILVANFTMPDYISALKKAGGIVTDDGGVTSHAAIISRELRKPCVVGTKIATQVLKTGDLVELDATKGIVKIIK